MTRFVPWFLAATAFAWSAPLVLSPLAAQSRATATDVPVIPHESVPNFFKNPPGIYTGENMGIATSSRGTIYIYHRAYETRLFEYTPQGAFVREIGRNNYGFAFAHSVRVDAQDNIWAVDEGTDMLVKFSPAGKVLMTIGRREDPVAMLNNMPGGGSFHGRNEKYRFGRQTDVAFDQQGNIFVSDGYFDARVVKYDKNGRFVKAVGTRGNGNLQFNTPHSIATDFQGNVYVGDRGNARVQVLDNDLNWKTNYTNVGNPWAVCVSGGPGPKNPGKQYLYVSNSWPDSAPAAAAEFTGEVYKMELDGTIVGKFGRAGKALGEFATIHQLDCRDPDVIYTAEINNWRSQKILLKGGRESTVENSRSLDREDSEGGPGVFHSRLPTPSQTVPDIAFDTNADLLKTPNDLYVGEVAGVGANSKGQIFVYTRTGHPYATLGDNRTFSRGGSRLFQFDPTGKFVRELGQDVYGFNAAIGLRVDPQDNVWTIDAAANQVVKFDPEGRVALVLGRKPETISVRPAQPGGGRGGAAPGAQPAAAPPPGAATPPAAQGRGEPPPGAPPAPGRGGQGGRGGTPGAGTPGSSFNRPADVAWDSAGNIYVADGLGTTNRIAKFDKDGRFITHWGSTGAGPGQFNGVKALAVDAQGNVYAADMGNKRIQVFDSQGTFKSEFGNVGTPIAMCLTRGATPHLYISHAGDQNGMDDAAILKVQLDGKVVGKFGSAGKLPKEFGLANSIDCRNDPDLLIGEMTNWRVQKVALKR
jgi:sugar lactone lactonase YvrE